MTRFASPALAGLPPEIERVVAFFRKLPGVGEKTALRYALFLAAYPEHAQEMGVASSMLTKLGPCPACGHIARAGLLCGFCADRRRQDGLLCVVASVQHLLAVERSGAFKGRYHVLGKMVSPLEGVNLDDMRPTIDRLAARLSPGMELLLALPPTTDGGATAMAIAREFAGAGLTITSIARGMARNASLEDADAATLTIAIERRKAAES